MGKILYMPGSHRFYPEMGDKTPEIKMEARPSVDGKHYIVDTPEELKGRGIVRRKTAWIDGCQKQIEGWKSYRVTEKAYSELEKRYAILRPCFLD